MADNLELGLFLAVLMAFVVCGCLVSTGSEKGARYRAGETLNSGAIAAPARRRCEQF